MKLLSAELTVFMLNLETYDPLAYYPKFPPDVWQLAEDISVAIRIITPYKEACIDHLLDEL